MGYQPLPPPKHRSGGYVYGEEPPPRNPSGHNFGRGEAVSRLTGSPCVPCGAPAEKNGGPCSYCLTPPLVKPVGPPNRYLLWAFKL